MRIVFLALAMAILAGCGGRVTGEVAKACVAADRRAASNSLCSCVQQAANRTLNASDQALAASFFDDPERAQSVRTATDRRSNAFWDRYKRFSETAEQMCG
jgi:aspartate oxidase